MILRAALPAVGLALLATITGPSSAQAVGKPPTDAYESDDGDVRPQASINGRRISGTLTVHVGDQTTLRPEQRGASCNGCAWVVETTGDIAMREGVPAARLSLPCFGSFRRVFYRASATAQLQPRGSFCLDEGEDIASDAEVEESIRGSFRRYLPKVDPSVQPSTRALVNLPAIFDSGQPAGFATPVTAAGVPVRLTASPTWVWHFDTGVERRFTLPGGEWPNTDVTHTYVTPGTKRIWVTTTWQASYSVAGGPPVPLGSSSIRSEPFTLDVVESQAQLVAPD